ncbi:hypothetical protein [Streptomyces sp. SID3343]|uniref:hypothetical protein n=1 Tax=Streptomyces sp. SID3343 TaxID=2690260 RepID=UPI00136BC992|nr:hypothetical protein [Streptomyces sp. SID3343]MYW01476.1 hypothetical protein [Streptomyces sp. SID3343]
MQGDPDAASWSPIDTTAWYQARSAVAALRDVLIAAGLAEHFPHLRADVNAFGHGFVELGRTTPEAAHRLAELLAAATTDPT